MKFSLQNKVALITGASTGIGKEFVKIHAENKGDLVIVARSEGKLQTLAESLRKKGASVHIIVKDLTQPSAPQEIYDEIKQQGIEVEYLINNAGFGGHGYFHERDWQQDLSMINLNITALSALCSLFLPEFVAKNSGKILNVSSTASLMGGPLQAVYFATKAYVTSFSNALFEELRNSNVSVTALLPGATETEFAKTSGMDKTNLFKNTFKAYDVAKAGYEAMLAGKMEIIAGVTFGQKMMMNMIPLTPKKVMLKQIHKMQELKK